MLYVETVSPIMFNVSCLTVPTNISNLFIKANEKHNHKTRFSSSCNFYINRSRLNQNHGSLLGLEQSFGTQYAMNFITSPRELSKNISMTLLFSLLEAEDERLAHSASKNSKLSSKYRV